jgi:hypothetical protein
MKHLIFDISIIVFTLAGCAASNPAASAPTEMATIIPTHPPVATQPPASIAFGQGYIASIAIKDINNKSREEIIRLLIGGWLDDYKKGSSQDAIKDYTIDKVTIMDNPPDPNYEIVAKVIFSVIPIEYSENWASMVTSLSDPNDPWWHLGTTFGVVRDSDYFRLKLLPGWGT